LLFDVLDNLKNEKHKDIKIEVIEIQFVEDFELLYLIEFLEQL
jgi:hypothetical protein